MVKILIHQLHKLHAQEFITDYINKFNEDLNQKFSDKVDDYFIRAYSGFAPIANTIVKIG